MVGAHLKHGEDKQEGCDIQTRLVAHQGRTIGTCRVDPRIMPTQCLWALGERCESYTESVVYRELVLLEKYRLL
jgi:hypothetical protein